jgi:hypothetical protein
MYDAWHHHRENPMTQVTFHHMLTSLYITSMRMLYLSDLRWILGNGVLYNLPLHIARAHPQCPDGRRPVLFPAYLLQCIVPQLQAALLHSVVLARTYYIQLKYQIPCLVPATCTAKCLLLLDYTFVSISPILSNLYSKKTTLHILGNDEPEP